MKETSGKIGPRGSLSTNFPPPPAWPSLSQFYGRSRQRGRPVGARCLTGLGRNPLLNALIQHTLKINFLFVEKFTVIPWD